MTSRTKELCLRSAVSTPRPCTHIATLLNVLLTNLAELTAMSSRTMSRASCSPAQPPPTSTTCLTSTPRTRLQARPSIPEMQLRSRRSTSVSPRFSEIGSSTGLDACSSTMSQQRGLHTTFVRLSLPALSKGVNGILTRVADDVSVSARSSFPGIGYVSRPTTSYHTFRCSPRPVPC